MIIFVQKIMIFARKPSSAENCFQSVSPAQRNELVRHQAILVGGVSSSFENMQGEFSRFAM